MRIPPGPSSSPPRLHHNPIPDILRRGDPRALLAHPGRLGALDAISHPRRGESMRTIPLQETRGGSRTISAASEESCDPREQLSVVSNANRGCGCIALLAIGRLPHRSTAMPRDRASCMPWDGDARPVPLESEEGSPAATAGDPDPDDPRTSPGGHSQWEGIVTVGANLCYDWRRILLLTPAQAMISSRRSHPTTKSPGRLGRNDFYSIHRRMGESSDSCPLSSSSRPTN